MLAVLLSYAFWQTAWMFASIKYSFPNAYLNTNAITLFESLHLTMPLVLRLSQHFPLLLHSLLQLCYACLHGRTTNLDNQFLNTHANAKHVQNVSRIIPRKLCTPAVRDSRGACAQRPEWHAKHGQHTITAAKHLISYLGASGKGLLMQSPRCKGLPKAHTIQPFSPTFRAFVQRRPDFGSTEAAERQKDAVSLPFTTSTQQLKTFPLTCVKSKSMDTDTWSAWLAS